MEASASMGKDQSDDEFGTHITPWISFSINFLELTETYPFILLETKSLIICVIMKMN